MKINYLKSISICFLFASMACQKEKVEERTEAKRYQGFSLASQNCASNFEILDLPPGQEEVGQKPVNGITMEEIETQLKGDGATGWIHAAIPAYKTWVWTIRQKSSFFSNYQFPLAFSDSKVAETMMTLKRHDMITIKGEILKNGAAHKHIFVTEVIVKKRIDEEVAGKENLYNKYFKPNEKRDMSIPNELAEGTSAIVKVHSIDHDGKSMTVEYKDMVIQVIVDDPSLTKDLYRNDKIKIQYRPEVHPQRPLHLVLDVTAAKPVEMIDRLKDMHRKEAVVEGCLVLFPVSPQINRNIFALLEVDKFGVMRTWTLANFEHGEDGYSMPVFDKISQKLQNVWDADTDKAINFRNKMLNSNIRVRAQGTLNIVAANQANPQILLSGPEKLQLSIIGK